MSTLLSRLPVAAAWGMVAVLMLAPRVEALVARCLMLREDAQANVDRLLRAAQTTGALK